MISRVAPRTAVVFCMPDPSHFHRLCSIISGLAARGLTVHVFTGQRMRAEVEGAGGQFVDLFEKHSLDSADAESVPLPSRLVTYAGRFADHVARRVAELSPSIVVHDTFAVVGWVVADMLGISRVNVCAGHNVVPARIIEELKTDPRVRISPRCADAVHLLRTKYGVPHASPFSYVEGLSRQLNLYCEPPEFLEEDERAPFEPLAFYGSLPDALQGRAQDACSTFGPVPDGTLKVYVCFGTIIWRYYAAQALRALGTLAEFFGRQAGVRVVLSLGGTAVDPGERASLVRSNVTVETAVDQWSMLADADCFFTHHGLNSTHEAIYHGVPMISYPFFWDQPSLAAKCHRLGLAIPLTDTARGPLSEAEVDRAWQRFLTGRQQMTRALDAAREWELAVLAGRPAILERIADLGR